MAAFSVVVLTKYIHFQYGGRFTPYGFATDGSQFVSKLDGKSPPMQY
jgi:hypothetical protein